MWTRTRDIAGTIFIKWMSSPQGAALLSGAVGVMMAALAWMTEALRDYAPLSYGVAILVGAIAFASLLRLVLAVMAGSRKNYRTREATFLEYRIENRRANLTAKANVYREPTTALEDVSIFAENRKARRKSAATGERQLVGQNLSLSIIVLFERPIDPESFLVRIEPIHGTCPTRDHSTIDDRWCKIVLSNIHNDTSFRVRFN